jgi:tripartite-type tricarboxylate transporter receptor subunit TctC
MTSRRNLLLAAAALAAGSAAADPGYPARPVRVVVPYAPGGGADTVSRILFGKLGELWKQNFTIDNRGGGGGLIGAAAVASAPSDGYTVLYDATAHSVNPSLYARMPYDPQTAFAPVFLAALVPNLLVVHPSVQARTVADVVALAKATSGGLDWASSGNGGVQHLSLELFRTMAGVRLNHVPYKGGGPALTDLVGGQVKFYFSNAAASTGHVRSGALRAIAHTGRGRLASFPDLPPVSDTLAGFEAYEWNGVFVPRGTRPDIVARLNAGLNQVIADPQVRERLAGLSVQTRANTPQEFGTFVAAETEKWAKVVKSANVRVE